MTIFACSTGPEAEVGTSSTTSPASVRQTDAAGRTLPFENPFEKRWNSSNDGTPYEPCTAVDQRVADEVGLDLSTTADAAAVSGQTLRGCRWDYAGEEVGGWGADQVVADFESLESYKNDNKLFNWRPDITLNGRTVGVTSMNDTNCFTYVQSYQSGVTTAASYRTLPAPTLDEVCERAIELTKATIDKIPNG
ncbi:DUF3558 family protein [Gordonia aquimaris]|uniref:DUF3558 family protein n=1 Tax=Gordonia aquimaris TaxID=2984863 RepID=A0A9X3D7U2_9ACTN|nr:DUF3558 family protein [Gordonia aquimaris]MCX2966317.1 DUF3558 family protein [Gordonia aquimaris]